MSEAVQQITPYEEFYEYMLQKVDMIPTSVERENFIGIWTPVLKTMCEARFSAQPVVFDILKLSLLYWQYLQFYHLFFFFQIWEVQILMK